MGDEKMRVRIDPDSGMYGIFYIESGKLYEVHASMSEAFRAMRGLAWTNTSKNLYAAPDESGETKR